MLPQSYVLTTIFNFMVKNLFFSYSNLNTLFLNNSDYRIPVLLPPYRTLSVYSMVVNCGYSSGGRFSSEMAE